MSIIFRKDRVIAKSNPMFMLVVKTVACFGFLIMSSAVFYAIFYGDLVYEGSALANMPWGIVSLVDIYLGLVLFSLWVMWREENKTHGVVWAGSILLLGNMISCLYILKALYQSEGNLLTFWLGPGLPFDKHFQQHESTH